MEDLAGEVRLTVHKPMEMNSGDGPRGPISCPECAQTQGLTLVARHREANVECLQGHQWHEPAVTAAFVRTVMHQANAGHSQINPWQPVMMLPVLDEPDDLVAIARDADDVDEDSPLNSLIDERNAAEFAADLANHDSAPRYCFAIARRMACLALPACGDVYARLYPPAGGSGVDAHMSVVVLALACYKAVLATGSGTLTGGARLSTVPFESVAEQLSPGNAITLRACRPRAAHGRPRYFLRTHDMERLENASEADFERWRYAADATLAFTASEATQSEMWQSWATKSPNRPFDLRFANRVVPTFPDDNTWYVAPPAQTTISTEGI